MSAPFLAPNGVPLSPYMQRLLAAQQGGASVAPAGHPAGVDPAVLEYKRHRLQALFAGAPDRVARMLAEWVITFRPAWDISTIVPGTVAIGSRLATLAPGQQLPLRLTVPTTTGFYGLAIVTREAETGQLVPANTDVLFSIHNKAGRPIIGSSAHKCPVAPFDPMGHGFTSVAPFLMGDHEQLKVDLDNQSESRTYTVTASVMGLGLYTPEGGTQ